MQSLLTARTALPILVFSIATLHGGAPTEFAAAAADTLADLGDSLRSAGDQIALLFDAEYWHRMAGTPRMPIEWRG